MPFSASSALHLGGLNTIIRCCPERQVEGGGVPGGWRGCCCAGRSHRMSLGAASSWQSLSRSLGPKARWSGQQPPGLLGLCGACPVLCCACLTDICSEHLFVLSLLSPVHPPLSVCQNTNGPFLGPCNLVSIRVTLVTASLLNLCA